MPASYLSKHRPICSVLEEIRNRALINKDDTIVALCDEATGYAKSMSAKLSEYKEASRLRSLLLSINEEDSTNYLK